jgi:hypothetical protein
MSQLIVFDLVFMRIPKEGLPLLYLLFLKRMKETDKYVKFSDY